MNVLEFAFSKILRVQRFYVSDLRHRAFHCDGGLEEEKLTLASGSAPIAVHVQLHIPRLGIMFATADNGGEGYVTSGTWMLMLELARSRVACCRRPPSGAFTAWCCAGRGRPRWRSWRAWLRWDWPRGG